MNPRRMWLQPALLCFLGWEKMVEVPVSCGHQDVGASGRNGHNLKIEEGDVR